MEHEARVLPALASKGITAPGLLFADEVDGRYVTVQSPLAGKLAPLQMTQAHERFLASMRNGAVKPASATKMVATLAGRIAALAVPHPQLAATLEQILPVLESTDVPSTVVHGDFAPWNLRINHGRISAFDWEYGELDGLPLIDQTHYTLQLGFQLNQWDTARAYRCLSELAAKRPLGLRPEQVGAMHAVYLLDNLVRLLSEGYPDDDEMVRWYRELLERVVVPQRESVLV
jgi:hypothetical protein